MSIQSFEDYVRYGIGEQQRLPFNFQFKGMKEHHIIETTREELADLRLNLINFLYQNLAFQMKPFMQEYRVLRKTDGEKVFLHVSGIIYDRPTRVEAPFEYRKAA